jgi:hypothetical protein
MIEVLIEAERALTHGLIDQAERLYRQVADNDPKSSIAVMGLARVALDRGDDRTAFIHGRAALAIDPDNPAAQHLVMRLTEVMAGRGETPPDVTGSPSPGEATEAPAAPARTPPASPAPPGIPARAKSNGLIGRIMRRRPRSR